MDPNETLRQIRTLASKVSSEVVEARHAGYAPELADVAMSLASRVWLLDNWLSGGGNPPEAWREGPDMVGTIEREG